MHHPLTVRSRLSHLRGWTVLLGISAWLCTPASAWAHGAPPAQPEPVWQAWNWDGRILLLMLLSGWLYLRGGMALWQKAKAGRVMLVWRAAAFAGGGLALFLALISPIDRMGSALFAIHMVQHMVLVFVAAPLLVLGAPHLAFLWALPIGRRRALARCRRQASGLRRGWRGLTHPVPAWALHVGALWLWHVPSLYEAALESDAAHALEHLSFTGSALLFWWVLFHAGVRRRMGYGGALFYIFAAMTQGAILGALITFAPTPWYSSHSLGMPGYWNLSPLEDQQLAGLIMWIPAGPLYLCIFLLFMARWLRASEKEAQRKEPAFWANLGRPRLEGQRERWHVADDAQTASSS